MNDSLKALFTVIVEALEAIHAAIGMIERRLFALSQPRSDLSIPVSGGNVLDRSISSDKIESLTADLLIAGKLDAQLVDVINLNASNINTGALNASLITTGTLNAALANVINLNASNINAGVLSADRIAAGSIDVTKLVLRDFVSGVIFTNNSPVAGSVSWGGSYAVYLEGTTYAINAGNTANKYIWFDPSASATTLQTSNSFTPAANRFLVAINNSGIITEVWRQLAANMITASMLSPASVTGGATGAIAANTITGDNIAANTITGDKIQAKTILANRLVVGNFENLCEDPNFEQQSTASWSSLYGSWAYANDGWARNGLWALKKSATISDDEAFNILFAPCRPGDKFYAEAYLAGTGNGSGKVRISFYNANQTARTFSDSSSVFATSSYGLASLSAACPSGYVWVRLSVVVSGHTYGLWYVDDCLLKQKQVAAYIESLNAAQITSGVIDAARLAAASIDATKLTIKDIIVTGLTLSNNSPSAGHIAWSGSPLTVFYDGASYVISNGSTNQPLVYWDVGASVFSAAASFTPQAGRFLIATNTSGVGMEAWNNSAARNALQDSNILGGLIRGIQPRLAHQQNNVNGINTYTLVNHAGQGGGLFTIGFHNVDGTAYPALSGWLQVLLGIKIDNELEQQYAVVDAAFPYEGTNSWDARLVCIAADKKGPGYNVGDYVTLNLGFGFSHSLVIKVYTNLGVAGGSRRFNMTVMWGTKTT